MPIMHYHFPFVSTVLHYLAPSQALQDHGYRLAYHAMCLFTSPAFARYSLCLPTKVRLRLSKSACLVLRRGGLQSPIQALTGPGLGLDRAWPTQRRMARLS